MKIKFLLFVCILFSSALFAQQTVLDNVYVKETAITRQVIPYPYLREADVMWSKRIWRVIDLNEKINLPLKFPSSKSTHDRKNLMDVIYDAIKEGSLTAYGYEDDEFTKVITLKEVENHGGARVDTVQMTRPDPPMILMIQLLLKTLIRIK
ncbi:MAG: hypothetical protein IPP51_02035 [Bacteroidetes bacterium]|nr:hypothetical protein [Bacteroidota bacterium]